MNVAINGMGVLGRQLLKYLISNNQIADVKFINDPYITIHNLVYLLKHDSIYGTSDLQITIEGSNITINGKQIPFYQLSNVADLPLAETASNTVIDCLGELTTGNELSGYTTAGASLVIATHPCDNTVPIIVPYVNHETLNPSGINIITLDSAELQVAATILTIFEDAVNYISYGSVHLFSAYTNAQNTIDSFNESDYALGRAAAWNISPVKSSLGKSIGKTNPALNGKFFSLATRAPVIDGGMLVVDGVIDKPVTIDNINAAIKEQLNNSSDLQMILAYAEDQIVSSDVRGRNNQFFMSTRTMTSSLDGETYFSVTVMYDNIQAYVNSICQMLTIMGNS